MGRHETLDRALAVLKRQGVALLGLAMIAAGGIWAAIALAASSEVMVDGAGRSKSVDVADLGENVNERYRIGNDYPRIEGVSLRKVLDQGGVGFGEWTRIFIGSIEVSRDEYDDFQGGKPPVFYVNKQDQVVFLRPRKDGEAAVLERAGNRGLRMNYRIPIEIESKPDLGKARGGDTVTFTAEVPGPNSGYSFRWNANGTTGTERKFEYTLPSSGEVEVNVEGTSGGQTLAEQTISTKVKEPPEENDGSGSSGFGGTGPSYTPPFTPSTPDYSPNFPDSTPSPDTPAPPDPDSAPEIEEETGTSVTGELLSATSPLPAPSGDDGAAAEDESRPPPEEVADEAKQVNAPGALIAGGVIVGLLGLGAGRELENKRPRRLLKRPDFSALRRLSPPWK